MKRRKILKVNENSYFRIGSVSYSKSRKSLVIFWFDRSIGFVNSEALKNLLIRGRGYTPILSKTNFDPLGNEYKTSICKKVIEAMEKEWNRNEPMEMEERIDNVKKSIKEAIMKG